MARSYKKNPVVKDSSKGMKSIANRIFRRKKNICVANGNAYRKCFCSYNISDWWFRETYYAYLARARRYRSDYENGIGIWGRSKDYSVDMSYWQWFKMYKCK